MLKASQEEIEKHSKKRKRWSSPEPVVVEVIEPTANFAEVSMQTDFQWFCLWKNKSKKHKEESNLVEKQNEIFESELRKVRTGLC